MSQFEPFDPKKHLELTRDDPPQFLHITLKNLRLCHTKIIEAVCRGYIYCLDFTRYGTAKASVIPKSHSTMLYHLSDDDIDRAIEALTWYRDYKMPDVNEHHIPAILNYFRVHEAECLRDKIRSLESERT